MKVELDSASLQLISVSVCVYKDITSSSWYLIAHILIYDQGN